MLSASLLILFTAILFRETLSCEDIPLPTHQRIQSFIERDYDYLIVGGGTAGLAVAARLAEHTSFEIGVIEAGIFRHADPNVDIPSNYPLLMGPDYDWGFKSIPQIHADQRSIPMVRGKMMGGSSGINSMDFSRASISEYDAFNAFANSDSGEWTWNGLLPHFRSTQRTPPSDPFSTYLLGPSNFDEPQSRGYHGPIAVSLNEMYSSEIPDFLRTVSQLGVDFNPSSDNGNTNGIRNAQLSVDRVRGVRSYAATEYYCNQPPLPNLSILVGAQATRIQLEKGGNDSKASANGVEFFVPSLKQNFKVSATKEVILSAGTIQTPQLLELSGIGNSSLLENLGIPVIINNPGVGENLQDHFFVPMQFNLISSITTFDTLRKNQSFMEMQAKLYNETGGGLLAAINPTQVYLPLQNIGNSDRVDQLLGLVEAEAASVDNNSTLALQYALQLDWIRSGSVSYAELIVLSSGLINPQPNTTSTSVLIGLLHPMSRGSVHIHKNDPLVPPTIDPGYLSSDFDLKVLLDALKFTLKISRKSPFGKLVLAQLSPDPEADDDSLRDYIRMTGASGSHFLGTAALGPFGNGGVVNASLKVHGTSNLRIVDASVIPIQISAHTQATVYAIAEAAADRIIRGT